MAVLNPVAETPNPAARAPGQATRCSVRRGMAARGRGSRTTRARCSAPVTGTTTGRSGTTTSGDLSLESSELAGDFYLAGTRVHVTGTAMYRASVLEPSYSPPRRWI
ncbi:unnamed protein product [Urochloa humidicola]